MRGAAIIAVALLLTGCGLNMERQARPGPQRSADLWPGGPATQAAPDGVVATGQGEVADKPPAMTLALLQRGQARYAIYCAPCHGARGRGDGPVVKRGFPAPQSFADPRVASAPVSHLHDVAANGQGLMYGFGDRVPPADLWAIAAYVRALQMADAGGSKS